MNRKNFLNVGDIIKFKDSNGKKMIGIVKGISASKSKITYHIKKQFK